LKKINSGKNQISDNRFDEKLDLTEQIDREFSQIASLPDDRINLAHGALLIAKVAYPNLDESLYLERLDRIVSMVKRDITADLNSADIISRINHIIFDEEKFRGNSGNYYDPDNSYLNRVLDRKTGIPITLSLIYIEIAGRLGLDVRGIGLPRFTIPPANSSLIRFIGEKSGQSRTASKSFAPIQARQSSLILTGCSRSAEKNFWHAC